MNQTNQRHRRQIFPPVSLVLLIPVVNLAPVSTTPAANLPPVSTTLVAACHRYQWHRRQIFHRCRWQILEQYQAADILKWYIYVYSTTQRCPNKIIKNFLFEDFCHLPPVSTTLSCEYLPEFSKKFETALFVYLGAWGKLIHEKKVENLVALSL